MEDEMEESEGTTILIEKKDMRSSLYFTLKKALNGACGNQLEKKNQPINIHELTAAEITKIMEAKDSQIQENRRKLEEYNQSVQAIRKKNDDLERYLLHVQNNINPLVNSMKLAPPLHERSQKKYLQELEKQRKKFGAFKTDKEIDKTTNVKNAMRKYLCFNQCFENEYRELNANTYKSTPKSQRYKMKNKVSKEMGDFEKIYEIQEKRLNELKEKYKELLNKSKARAKEEIKNIQAEICKNEALKHIKAYNATEILLVQNNIVQLATNLKMTNKRIEFYTSRQKQLICELNDLTVQTEHAAKELSKMQSELCNRQCNEQNAQRVIEHTAARIERAEKINFALSKSICALDSEICVLLKDLKTLKKNKCREKECKKQLRTLKEGIVQCDSVNEASIKNEASFSEVKDLEDIIDEIVAQEKCNRIQNVTEPYVN